MTLKSLITIDVDDTAFEAFRTKFQAFQDTAKVSMGIAPSGSAAGGGFGVINEAGMADAVIVLNEIKELIRKILKQERDSGGGSGEGGMSPLGGGGGGFLSFLRGGVGKLFLGTIATAAGAAFAAYEGGKFILNGAGMGGLATDATAVRTAARGANVSFGAYRAFQTDLAPYGDGEHLLQEVASAQSDIRNPLNIALQHAGVGKNDTSDRGAVEILKSLRQAFLDTRSNPLLLQATLQQRQLGGVDPSGTFSRSVGAVSDKEFSQLLRQLEVDAKKLDVADHTAAVWQEMNQAVTRSKVSIETAFLQSLPAAAKTETNAVEQLASSLRQASDWIQKKFPSLTTEITTDSKLSDFAPKTGPGTGHTLGRFGAGLHGVIEWGKQFTQQLFPPSMATDLKPYSFENIKGALAQTESRGNSNALSPAGATGLYQIMPEVASKGYGYSAEQLKNPQVNAYIAEKEWTKLLNKYHDPFKAAAAYNWGQGHLDSDIKEHGSDWEKHLPRETQNYITTTALAQALRQIQNTSAQQQKIGVAVSNATGQDVSVQARMANR